MFYELLNGKLEWISKIDGNYSLKGIEEKKYVTELDENTVMIIDSIQNRCFVLPKDALKDGVSEEVYKEIYGKIDNIYHEINKYKDNVTFILAITYSCNLHCSYCYQQKDVSLDKKLISEENLDKIFEIIEQYMKIHPEKIVDLGLFGGEPLLIKNERIIDKVFAFCKKNGLRVHITTNGCYLDYYMKKLVINRNFISTINPTVDSVQLNYLTRCSMDSNQNTDDETEKLMKCIKTLLYYGIHVNVATNVDRHNYKQIWKTYEDFRMLGLMDSEIFTWCIGRVDDRLYETEYPDIIMESEIIPELQKRELPYNMQAAFLKTSYNLVEKMGLKFNQKELKGQYNYCWNSSDKDKVFYIDNNLKTYRCTYTVGRPQYSIFDFSLEALENYKIVPRTYASYKECKECNIGGYCAGGCQLSHGIDFMRCCEYEKKSFSYFIDKTFRPYVKELYKEIIDINEK